MPPSQRDLKFIDPSSWGDIMRGWIYEAAIPYVGQRPLSFFDRSTSSISTNNGTFTPGNRYEVVLPLKQRKVVVISNQDICSNPDRINVAIAPILSIEPSETGESWYKQAVAGTHPFFAYLPKEVTGRECVIVTSDIITIHKNMLLNDKKDISEYMPVVDSKLEYCFQLGIYKKSIDSETGTES